MRIWTEAYRPFLMGGDVHAPVSTEMEMELDGLIDIGHGLQAYLIVDPEGQTHVAESTTGAFIGTTIDQVRADLEAADPEVVRQQIEDAKERVKKADYIEPEQFWSLFK